MDMLRKVLALIVFAAIVGLLIMSGMGDSESGGPGVATAAPGILTTSDSCQECHPDVFAEWQRSYHAQSFTDPLVRAENMSNNFQKKDCIPCHAPRPVFENEIGIDARVVPRTANRHHGVDCLACHRMGDAVTASRPGLSGACNPVHEPRMKSMDQCAPCHDQHKTISGEWGESEFPGLGIDCNTCHMPEVQRPARNGRPAYMGRSHVFPGSHDPEFLKTAFTMDHRIEEQQLVVVMNNDGAGHHIPTDARHRAVDIIVTLFDEHGVALTSDEKREAGQEPGTFRWRLRNPYRTEVGKVDSRLPAGQSKECVVPLQGREARRALIQVVYKLTPYRSDDEGMLLYEQSVDLDS